MSWVTKLKEKAQDHLISGVFGLITLLFLIIWAAVPSEIWDKVPSAVPRKVLFALLGLALIAICLEAAYIFSLRKERKSLKENLETKLFFKFGALWDKDKTPYCPSCKNPLPQSLKGPYIAVVGSWSSVTPAKPVLECVQCNKTVTLIDDEGNTLLLKDAKEQLFLAKTLSG
jgi:hypothetical protein